MTIGKEKGRKEERAGEEGTAEKSGSRRWADLAGRPLLLWGGRLMYAYKGFEPDLSCRGYRFVMGKNVTPEANCASNGFHCAENPLDCLSYYGDMNRSIYCLVQPGHRGFGIYRR